MKRTFIYAVEPDPVEFGYLTHVFKQSLFEIGQAPSLGIARKNIEAISPDIILIERLLPDGDGVELCKEIRGRKEICTLPIVFVTKRGGLLDEISGFQAGADDYIVKPVKAEILLLRTQSLLRRIQNHSEMNRTLSSGRIRLNIEKHECLIDGKKIELWPKEFELLKILMRSAGSVVTRDFLAENIWNLSLERMARSRTIDVTIDRLRKKLGHVSIETVRGYGFRLKA